MSKMESTFTLNSMARDEAVQALEQVAGTSLAELQSSSYQDAGFEMLPHSEFNFELPDVGVEDVLDRFGVKGEGVVNIFRDGVAAVLQFSSRESLEQNFIEIWEQDGGMSDFVLSSPSESWLIVIDHHGFVGFKADKEESLADASGPAGARDLEE